MILEAPLVQSLTSMIFYYNNVVAPSNSGHIQTYRSETCYLSWLLFVSSSALVRPPLTPPPRLLQ